MKRIDLTNYEAWLLDYAEGTLSAEDTAELLLFMEQHPELQMEVDDLMEFTLPAEEIIPAEFKQHLHKDEADVKERFEHLCVAFYDKSISAEEKKELDFILQQKPYWEKEFNAFAYTYILQEPQIEFTAKTSLKKQFQPEGSFDDQAVKALEGLLSTKEQAAFEASLVEDTSKQLLWKAFQKTVLPQEQIVFEEKAALYQHAGGARVFPIWSRWIAAAASVALLVGAYSLLNKNGESGTGMASLQPDSIQQVRPAQPKNTAPVIQTPFESPRLNPPSPESPKKEKQNSSIQEVPAIQLRESFASLPSLKAQSIQEFELPSDYIAIRPEENIQTSPYIPTASVEPLFLTPKEYLVSKAKNLFQKQREEVEKPLNEIRKDGFAETGYRSIERLTRGTVNIERQKTAEGSRVTGFSIGSLAFSRTAH